MIHTDARQKTLEALQAVEIFKTPGERLDSWMKRMLLAMKEARECLGIPPRGSNPERRIGAAARSLQWGGAVAPFWQQKSECCDVPGMHGKEHFKVRFLRDWGEYQAEVTYLFPEYSGRQVLELGVARRA